MHNVLPSRHERIIFFSSLILTAIFLAIFIASSNITHPLARVDSDDYAPLAASLYTHGVFTFSTSSPYVLEGAHVPGYSFFLAFFAGRWDNVIPALLVQMLLFAFSGVLLYRLFEGVFSPRVRFVGALLYVLEPYTAFTIARPLTEAVFLTLSIGALLLARRAYERDSAALFFWSSVVFGMSVLVRPILTYALPLLVVCATVLVYSKTPRRALPVAAVTILGAALVLLPWAYRNHQAFGVWMIASKGAYVLYVNDMGLLLQYRDGIGAVEANTVLFNNVQAAYPEIRTQDDARSPKYAPFMMKESVALIRSSPLLYAKMSVLALGTYFLSDGYRLLWYESTGGAIALPNISKAVGTGNFSVLTSYVRENSVPALLLAFGFVFWASVFLLALFAVVQGSFRPLRERLVIVACALFIAYFAVLTGPVSQPRYRIVATPFLFMLASYSIDALLALGRKRTLYAGE